MCFKLPIYWTKGVKPPTTILVGMNWYRNAHHFEQAKFKKDFHKLLSLQPITITPITGTYSMHYILYYKNSNCDGANIIALIEKVVLDYLQEIKIVSNDTVKQHIGSSWIVAGQDKINPRVEIQIIPIKENF